MNEWVQIAGWVLVHFLWQGSALAIVAAAALRFCRRRSSSVRYVVACLALGAMLAAPLLTAFMLASQLSPATFVSGSALRDAGPSIAAGRGTLEVFRAAQEVLAKTARVSTIEAYFPLIVSVWLAGVAVLLLRDISRLVSDSTPAQGRTRLGALVVATASEPTRATTALAQIRAGGGIHCRRCAYGPWMAATGDYPARRRRRTAASRAGGGGSRSRTRARSASRLSRESSSESGGGGSLLPSCDLVDLRPCSRRTRALLR